jgi:curved DNA-binding protein CbpA
MQDYGIDAVAVQRFVSVLSDPKQKRRADNLLKNVMLAAQATQRGFFVVYDISGANPNTVINDIRQDWRYLLNEIKVTENSAYLKDKTKSILELWGFGFTDRPGSPDAVFDLQQDLKNAKNPVTLVGGVPTYWRTLSGDSKSQIGWDKVYRNYDVLSPWAVGRFGDNYGADQFIKKIVIPDLIETQRLGLAYLPVIFPGFSWHNLMINRHNPSKAILNQIPRRCGQFLQRQIDNLLKLKVSSIYVAMFDEVDEATAVFPVETVSGGLPAEAKMVYLNQDGCDLASDWYLQTLKNVEIIH